MLRLRPACRRPAHPLWLPAAFRGERTLPLCPALCLPQRAIAAANAAPGVVLFPPGTYILTKPITVYRGKVVLRGAGVGCRGGAMLWGRCRGGELVARRGGMQRRGLDSSRCAGAAGKSGPARGAAGCAGLSRAHRRPLPRSLLLPLLQQGLTTIHIPVSLSDVYPGTWTENGGARCLGAAGQAGAAPRPALWSAHLRARTIIRCLHQVQCMHHGVPAECSAGERETTPGLALPRPCARRLAHDTCADMTPVGWNSSDEPIASSCACLPQAA